MTQITRMANSHPRHPRNPRLSFSLIQLAPNVPVIRGGDPMLHEEITKDIIGAAMAVLNELRPGLDEKLYENALVIELLARGPPVQRVDHAVQSRHGIAGGDPGQHGGEDPHREEPIQKRQLPAAG